MFAGDSAGGIGMPFDCSPIIETPKLSRAADADLLDFRPGTRATEPVRPRPIPAWHVSLRPETVGDTLALLARARVLLADEQRWCQRAFARSWLKPVPPQSAFAGRFCAIGAIMRAGRELGLPTKDACRRPQGRRLTLLGLRANPLGLSPSPLEDGYLPAINCDLVGGLIQVEGSQLGCRIRGSSDSSSRSGIRLRLAGSATSLASMRLKRLIFIGELQCAKRVGH